MMPGAGGAHLQAAVPDAAWCDLARVYRLSMRSQALHLAPACFKATVERTVIEATCHKMCPHPHPTLSVSVLSPMLGRMPCRRYLCQRIWMMRGRVEGIDAVAWHCLPSAQPEGLTSTMRFDSYSARTVPSLMSVHLSA